MHTNSMYDDPRAGSPSVLGWLLKHLLLLGSGGLGLWVFGLWLAAQGVPLPDDFNLFNALLLVVVFYALVRVLLLVLVPRQR